jgi:hypothetical protein
MPSPKNGKKGCAVAPAEPRVAQEADCADPGLTEKLKAEQRLDQNGKYGASEPAPHKAPESDEEKARKKSWIEIELVDKETKPVAGERYKITLPDETLAEGTLDEKGFARVEGIEPGTCRITFPDLEKSSWNRA